MEKNAAEEKTIELFSNHFGIERKDIEPTMELVKDFNLSPLEVSDFLFVIENAFQIEILQEASEQFVTLADIISYVSDHGDVTSL